MDTLILKVRKLILSSPTYLQFEGHLKNLKDNKSKGDYQEIFAKYYFESHRKHYDIKKYYSRLLDVIPEELGLHKEDVGVDAVIVHNNNKISPVQVKFRSNVVAGLHRGHVSGMSLEAISLIKTGRFGYMYLLGNSLYQPKKINQIEKEHIKYVLGDTLIACNWELVHNYVRSLDKESVAAV